MQKRQKTRPQKGKIEDNMVENYKDRELVVNINQKDEEVIDEPEKLFDGIESDGDLVNVIFYLPLDELQDRTKTITLEGLKEIESLKASNGGKVEVLEIDGDDVTIKVTGGDIAKRVVISGQYIPEHTKLVEKQETPNYSDSDGYTGILTRYLAYHEPAYNKPVSSSRTSLLNIFPSSIDYTEDGLKTTLYKSGNPERKVIMGSDTHTKSVTAQRNKDYLEIVMDNGILTSYRGNLTQYVYSGEASKSKISTTTRSNTMNIFPERINFEDGDYSGVLWKTGPSTSVVTKGSARNTKKVTAQPNANYNEKIDDNGVTTSAPNTNNATDKKIEPDKIVPNPTNTAATAVFVANFLMINTIVKNTKPVIALSITFGMKPAGNVVNKPDSTPVAIASKNVSLKVGNSKIPINIIVNMKSGFIPCTIPGVIT